MTMIERLRLLFVCSSMLLSAACTGQKAAERFKTVTNPANIVNEEAADFKNAIPLEQRMKAARRATPTPTPTQSSEPVVGSPSGVVLTFGSGDQVNVVAFLDLTDAFSQRFYQNLRAAVGTAEKPSNLKVRLELKPLPNKSSELAVTASKMVLANKNTGRNLDFVDRIFDLQLSTKNQSDLLKIAESVGISANSLAAESADASVDLAIAALKDDLAARGGGSSPTVFINGVRVYDFETSAPNRLLETISKIKAGVQ